LEGWFSNIENNFEGVKVRELKILPDIFLSNFNLSKPYKLTFTVTSKCNYRCVHCNIWKKKPKNELTLDEISRFSRKYPYFKWFNLTGGEPFLRTDFVEIVKILKENSLRPTLFNTTTNGFNPSYIYEKVKEILSLRTPRNVVVISLDGYKELHEKIRGINESFDRAIETFLLLKNLSEDFKNFITYFGYTLSHFNVENFLRTFFEVKNKIKDLTLDDFHINIYHTSAHYYSNLNENVKEKEKIKEELSKLIKLKTIVKTNPTNVIDNIYLKEAYQYLKTNKAPLPCKALTSSVFIDSFGYVYPCSIWSLPLGSLRENNYDLEKILSSNKARIARLKAIKLKCPNCWTPCEANQTIIGNVPRLFIEIIG
jgi:MoaA/NifB/PqqE/SkfB family radical SAM enzyme